MVDELFLINSLKTPPVSIHVSFKFSGFQLSEGLRYQFSTTKFDSISLILIQNEITNLLNNLTIPLIVPIGSLYTAQTHCITLRVS